MKAVISAVSVLACALSLDAQITTTLKPLTDSSTEITIRNNSAASLVAFVIRVNPVARGPAARWLTYYDPAIDPLTQPLAPNESRMLERMTLICAAQGRPVDLLNQQNRKEALCEVEQPITAGILADGSTTGDGALLTWLLLRRSNMLLAVETTLEVLSDAGRRNVPRDQLIDQFKKVANSLRHWYLPEEQKIGLTVYQSIGKLMHLPEGPLGTPFPPAVFVDEETAVLRKRRVALSEPQPSLADVAFK